jgi:hypothetical protein
VQQEVEETWKTGGNRIPHPISPLPDAIPLQFPFSEV